jgi:acyl-CoA dehydrogenase
MSLLPLQADDPSLAQRVKDFVCDKVIPFERDPRCTAHGPSEDLRIELNALARQEGLLSMHVEPQWGGMGLSHAQKARVFEAAGYSTLGPVALHCAAPDEGNMHLLSQVATPEQQDRFLKPLASAKVRSCFAMTEPAPGAGADPGQLATVATWDGQGYVVHGRKWLITGAMDAGFMILMARTHRDGQDLGATMFLVPLPHPAVRIERLLDSMDASFTGGHAEIHIEGLRLSPSDVLGETGQGFKYAQVRLAPARLTHCMRWLGAAQRVHDVAVKHANERTAFGKAIGQHQGIGFQLADNDMDLHVARLVTQQAARVLDQGHSASFESSRAKVIVSEALYRVADRCVQVMGGMGLTQDTPVGQIFRELRAFRVYDGPSEVHRWSMARKILSHAQGHHPGQAR